MNVFFFYSFYLGRMAGLSNRPPEACWNGMIRDLCEVAYNGSAVTGIQIQVARSAFYLPPSDPAIFIGCIADRSNT